MNRSRLALWLPLAIFAGLFALFVGRLLHPGNTNVASAFVGNPLPQFDLPAANAGRPAWQPPRSVRASQSC